MWDHLIFPVLEQLMQIKSFAHIKGLRFCGKPRRDGVYFDT